MVGQVRGQLGEHQSAAKAGVCPHGFFLLSRPCLDAEQGLPYSQSDRQGDLDLKLLRNLTVALMWRINAAGSEVWVELVKEGRPLM